MAEGASLTVLGGPMAGTSLVIDDAVDEILIGSDPDCRLSLDLPGVSPIHARVWRDLAGMTVYDTHSARGLYVNDERVSDHASLHDGDVLWLGPPGDADSVMLQCRLPEESLLGAPAVDEAPAAPAEEATAIIDDTAPAAGFGAADPVPFAAAPPEPDIVTDAWAEQAPAAPPADEPDFFADDPDAVPPTAGDDAESLLDLAPPVMPVAAATAPAVGSSPAQPVEDGDDVLDPAWAESPDLEAPEPPPPALDIDSLLADDFAVSGPPIDLDAVAPPSPEPPTPAPPSPAPPPPAAAAPFVPSAPVPSAAPAPVGTTTMPFAGGAPVPPAPEPRAIIDDTRPRPAPRRSDAPARHAAPEGVMDWAKGAASPRFDEVPAAPPVRTWTRGAPPKRSGRGPLVAVAGAVLLLAALGGGYFAWSASRTPRIDGVSPTRASAGSILTLTGAHLGGTVAATSASIGGRPARIVQATGERLQVEVPELPATAGQDASVPILVTVDGRESKPASVAVYQAPRLKSLTPDVAMPGESVVLSGTSLAGVKVRFGDVEAQVLATTPESATVKVPALQVDPGTEVPVVAAVGADPSNAMSLVIGKVPLVTGIEPRTPSPGDLVTIAGRGFNARPAANRVTVGGVPALVVSAGPRGVDFVVPRVIAGEEEVTITVPGSSYVGQGAVIVSDLPEPIGFHFVAEPFEDVPGHEHAAVASGLGPAFILTTAQGKSAAERAYEAQKRLNEAAQVLRSTRTADIRARYEPAPVLYLAARDTVLLEVTAADAEAYDEDWVRGRPRGAKVTPARLATWWEAVARDLVLILMRGERPEHALAIAPEGKILADVHDAARRSVAVGVPSAMMAAAPAPMREALRVVALRVPPTASPPVVAATESAAPAPADGVPALKLQGTWQGSETESGIRKPISVVFRGGSGTLTYERALSMSVPVLALQQPQKGAVRFEVRVGSGTRYYRGRWDGSRIDGTMASDAAGRIQVGTFELQPPG